MNLTINGKGLDAYIKTENLNNPVSDNLLGKQGRVAVNKSASAPAFSLVVEGKTIEVRDPQHVKNIESFLKSGGSAEEPSRRETVAAVLFKDIEPTSSNLEAAHAALNAEVEMDEKVINEELSPEAEAEVAEDLDLPRDAIESLKQAVEKGRPLKEALREMHKELLLEKGEVSRARLQESDDMTVADLVREIKVMLKSRGELKSQDGSQQKQFERAVSEKVAAERALENKILSDKEVQRLDLDRVIDEGRSADALRAVGPGAAGFEDAGGAKDGASFSEAVPSDGALLGSTPLGATEGALAGVIDGMSDRASARVGLKNSAGGANASYTAAGAHAGSFDKVNALQGADAVGVDAGVEADGAKVGSSMAGGALGALGAFGESTHGAVTAGPDTLGSGKTADASLEESSINETDGSVSAAELSSDDYDIEKEVMAALSAIESQLVSLMDAFDFKQFLVTKTTEMTIKATAEFKDMQKQVSLLVNKGDAASIKAAIEELSKSLNKSSFAMLTDMKTEKTLLLAIKKLDEAMEALANGKKELAQKILAEVEKDVSGIDFKPSSRRVQLMVQQKAVATARGLEEAPVTMEQKMREAIQLFSSGTARDMLELVRFTGINHEIERYEQSASVNDIKNLKEMFSGTEFASQMSGQQMMNDSGDRPRDFYVMQLPLEIGGEIEGLKVLVNGRSEENVIDWKNTELYFGLNLAKAGAPLSQRGEAKDRIAVRLSIRGASVNIDVASDRSLRLDALRDILPEIGYDDVRIKQSAFEEKPKLFAAEKQQAEPAEEASRAADRSKGLDIRI